MTTFLRTLREICDVLQPFTRSIEAGSLAWDGERYAPAAAGRSPDLGALEWWSALKTMSDLLERQGAPVSQRQADYLEKTLFGGMGSLRDFAVDARFGPTAAEANEKLARLADALYAESKSLRSS